VEKNILLGTYVNKKCRLTVNQRDFEMNYSFGFFDACSYPQNQEMLSILMQLPTYAAE